MTIEEAFVILDTVFKQKHLSDLQELILRQSWEGRTYSEIAEGSGYDNDYIRDVGFRLWQLLSKAFGEKVTKNNCQSVLRRRSLQPQGPDVSLEIAVSDVSGQSVQNNSLTVAPNLIDSREVSASKRQDWGEAIDVSVFYGRTEELAQLEQWIVTARCRLVALLGMEGSGKTALSVKLAEQIQGEFEYLFWRSLLHAPPIEYILVELIQFLSNQQETDSPKTVDGQISRLIEYLRTHRCLLVLDNTETLLQSGGPVGYYREGYESYGKLFKRVGETPHQSCLVLTSRTKPEEVTSLEGETLLVRSLQLSGLNEVEAEEIFKAKRPLNQLTTVDNALTTPSTALKPGLCGNLPATVTSLVGREQEIAEACALFQRDDVRLLTLTGTGGTGKTRLALALAKVLQVTFADGVWFVALASIREPMHVIGAIAQTFGVQEAIDEPLLVRLANFLRQRQVLLVLDNFEHILDAATLISDLLAACANLKILVTSRTRLHLYGEWEFLVPQLTLPSCHQYLSCDQALESEAVRLFVARAQAIRRDFTLTNANAPVVAEICTRLDGLPLAIELAAIRSNLLDPPVLLKQLDRRLALLVGGPRDFPLRHRTLRAAIGWSYDLLPSPQQALFRRLGVFVGGWTLDAAKAVCQKNSDRSPNILDETIALLDCHLLKQESTGNDESRFAMLETIREYALEQLEELDEAAITRQEHATYYLGLAELAELNLQGKEQVMWLQRLNGDYENFRAALEWASHHGQYEMVARIAGALHHFWNVCSHLSDGSYWLKAALAHRDILSASILAKVLLGAGVLALRQANFPQAEKLCAESLAIYEQLDNKAGMSKAHNGLSLVMLSQSNFSEALLHSKHSVALERELGSVTGIAFALNFVAAPLLYQGKHAQARPLIDEALLLSRESENIFSTSFCLVGLGQVALASHNYTEAQRFFTEALALCHSLNFREGISWTLEGFAGLAAMQEQPVRAARLYGAAEALREFIGAPLPVYIRKFYESFIAAAWTQIDKASFAAIWQTGRAISLECAIAEALQE